MVCRQIRIWHHGLPSPHDAPVTSAVRFIPASFDARHKCCRRRNSNSHRDGHRVASECEAALSFCVCQSDPYFLPLKRAASTCPRQQKSPCAVLPQTLHPRKISLLIAKAASVIVKPGRFAIRPPDTPAVSMVRRSARPRTVSLVRCPAPRPGWPASGATACSPKTTWVVDADNRSTPHNRAVFRPGNLRELGTHSLWNSRQETARRPRCLTGQSSRTAGRQRRPSLRGSSPTGWVRGNRPSAMWAYLARCAWRLSCRAGPTAACLDLSRRAASRQD